MMQKRLIFGLLVLAVQFAGCARDVTGDLDEDPYPTQVTMAFRTRGEIDTSVWYYMVFNFTAAPSTTAATAPLDFISDEDRGRNWELYVALHRNDQGTDELWTLQRPPLPTVLPTDFAPTDCAAADFTGDARTDIAVACNAGDHVQLIRSEQVDIYDPVYYDQAEPINEGPGPRFIFAGELTGDASSDLLVVFDGTTGAFLRVLAGDSTGDFTAGTDQPVSGTPVDALLQDLDGDGELDLALLTTGAAAADKVVTIYLGDGAGVFTAGESYPAGDVPVALAAGQLDTGGTDLALADAGTGAASGQVRVLTGDGDGTFTAGPVLDVDGRTTGVSIGLMYGSLDDIVACYVDSSGVGQVGVFMNEAATPFEDTPKTIPVDGTPVFVLAIDSSGDQQGDALVVNGEPGSGGTSLQIKRGLREPAPNPLDPRLFVWDADTITYLTGLEPSRIGLADLDTDGKRDDLLIPNTADATNGNSVNLFFGLGKDNFTSADIYWTDQAPEPLTTQDWYISHSIGPNFFELTLDPGLFYDLAQLPPDQDSGFLVDFMTGTTGVYLADNPNQEGEIHDHLQRPINVPMTVGHYDDEQNTPLALNPVAVAAEDIDNWRVEVF